MTSIRYNARIYNDHGSWQEQDLVRGSESAAPAAESRSDTPGSSRDVRDCRLPDGVHSGAIESGISKQREEDRRRGVGSQEQDAGGRANCGVLFNGGNHS